MKKMSIIASLFAGALAFGCGSMRHDQATVQPHSVTGAAGTTGTGVDSTGNPTKGTASGAPAGRAPNPDEPPGVESGANADQPTEQLEGEPQLNIELENKGQGEPTPPAEGTPPAEATPPDTSSGAPK
jgi:hypothetical protein